MQGMLSRKTTMMAMVYWLPLSTRGLILNVHAGLVLRYVVIPDPEDGRR